jgi:hypothetical protein
MEALEKESKNSETSIESGIGNDSVASEQPSTSTQHLPDWQTTVPVANFLDECSYVLPYCENNVIEAFV